MPIIRAVRDLWNQSPVFLAAALAPIIFGLTFALLWWIIDDGAQPAARVGAVVERSAEAEQLDREFDAAVEAGEAKIGLPSGSDSAAAGAAAAFRTGSSGGGAAGSGAASSIRAAVPSRRDQLPDLRAVSKTPIEPEKAQYGGVGVDGATLPIANGIVRSSRPGDRTTWELYVPKASLYASVVRVGRTPWGGLGAPDNPEVIGWYEDGAEPGSQGNALLVGHLDYTDINGNVGEGVCYRLRDVIVGDQMIVRDSRENIAYVYEIISKEYVEADDPDAARYLSARKQSLLTLITCAGTFDPDAHEYSERLIVVGTFRALTRA